MDRTSKLLLLFYFQIFAIHFANSQSDSFFIPTQNDSLFFNKEFKEIEERYNTNISSIKGEFAKEFKEIYKERYDNIVQNFTSRKLYTNQQAQEYLNSLLSEIVKNNDELINLNLNIFFSKTENANATFVGENTIIFNTGLFHRLQNESQVAFVLCHELAHLYLKHSDQFIDKYVTTIYSKDFQKELNNIKNREYNKRTQLEKLALGLQFDNRKHSRYKENEADSLGLIFLTKTKFDNKESLSLLSILDNLDNENFDAEKSLKFNFNTINYPFQKSWLEKEEGLLSGHAQLKVDKTIADSLKTHPDCKKRIQNVQKLLEKYKQNYASKSIQNSTMFNVLKQKLPLENITFYEEKKQFSTVFFYTLKYLEILPNSNFLITRIGKCFNEFYNAQKIHQLNKIIMLPFPNNDESFNLVLQFIQNLNRDDYKYLSIEFLKKYEEQNSKYTNFNEILKESKSL